jgi:predicted HTH domain antitoxin
MSNVQVQLELPEELARRLDPQGTGLAARVMETVVLRLFQEKAISSGRAAKLLGITKDDFLDVLAQHDLPYFNQTIEEVLSDARVAAAARKRDSA